MANSLTKTGVGGAVLCAAAAIALQFIPAHEGNSLKAYRDTGGVYTVCAGIAYTKPGASYSPSQCRAMNDTAIGKFMAQVAQLVPADTSPETLAAYASMAYNIGIVGFTHSTTLKLARAGKPAAACDAMLDWYTAGGKDCRVRSNNCYGVWERRNDERALCLQGLK